MPYWNRFGPAGFRVDIAPEAGYHPPGGMGQRLWTIFCTGEMPTGIYGKPQ
jgi:hypothetical protein